jgi:hypothetical protein
VRIEQHRASYELKKRQVQELKIRAGVSGILRQNQASHRLGLGVAPLALWSGRNLYRINWKSGRSSLPQRLSRSRRNSRPHLQVSITGRTDSKKIVQIASWTAAEALFQNLPGNSLDGDIHDCGPAVVHGLHCPAQDEHLAAFLGRSISARR